MIRGEEKKIKGVLSKELILSKVDDYNIYKYYLGEDFDFKKKYQSPFRSKGVDTTPNLCFFPHSSGKILFKDFADGLGGDCFKFVQDLLRLNFYQTLEKINEDLGLNLKHNENNVFKFNLTKRPERHIQSNLIQIRSRNFTKDELIYWKQYYITKEELIKKNVYSIEKLYINKMYIPNVNKELRFAYKFDNYIKIYSPNSLTHKWISTTPNDYISGFDDIKHKVFRGAQSHNLVITKSVKDELILKKFLPDVCSTQNESTSSINSEDMKIILDGYNKENVFIAYDNDEAGMRSAKDYVKKYGFKTLYPPYDSLINYPKDWGELVKQNDGLSTLESILKTKNLID